MESDESSTVPGFSLLVSRFPVSCSQDDTIPKLEGAFLWLINDCGGIGYTGIGAHDCSLKIWQACWFGWYKDTAIDLRVLVEQREWSGG